MKHSILSTSILCIGVSLTSAQCVQSPNTPYSLFEGCNTHDQNWSQRNIAESSFINSSLAYITAQGSIFSRSNFSNTTITDSDINGSNFAQSNFKNATIVSSSLTNSELSQVQFDGATLTNVDLSGSTLTGSNLHKATLNNVTCPSGIIVSSPQNCNIYGDLKLVTIGNSLTAGMQDVGLRSDKQAQSYPQQLAHILGIQNFSQPLVAAPGIGFNPSKTPMYIGPNGFPTQDTLTAAPIFTNYAQPNPYNNLGVPGAFTIDLLQATDASTSIFSNNGFFDIVLRNSFLGTNATELDQAISQDPDILNLWIGNNDILGGVTEGVVIPGVSVTPVPLFEVMVDQILTKVLSQTTAEIFLANVPPMNAIPLMTTIPAVAFDPQTFQPIPGNIPLCTEDEDVVMVSLYALPKLTQGIGHPSCAYGELSGRYTLSREELNTANAIVEGYNQVLQEWATNNPRVHLVDTHGLLESIQQGNIPNSSTNWAIFDPQNSVFSLDGFHPNSKGYSLIANLFADQILPQIQ